MQRTYRDEDPNWPATITVHFECETDGEPIPHRAGAPARITKYDSGAIKEEWFQTGYLHRLGGPAKTLYGPDGTVQWEEWYEQGRLHRDGAPARIVYRKGLAFELVYFYERGLAHRPDGPAVIGYSPAGEIRLTEYWLDGRKKRSPKAFDKQAATNHTTIEADLWPSEQAKTRAAGNQANQARPEPAKAEPGEKVATRASVRISPQLHALLKQAAQDQNTSIGKLLTAAVEHHLNKRDDKS